MSSSSLSVVIPVLDEAERLPGLLRSLATQTRPPDQVVVADAGSTDGTPEIAAARGALVVAGGMPAAGRNAGARAATGDLLLFLDGDVEMRRRFIGGALEESAARDLVCASAYIEPIETDARYVFACEVVNLYLEIMQYVSPHAPGFCIMTRRAVHEAIGGFDEDLALAEDHDYVQRAAEHGRFRMLRCCPVRTSMRRVDKEGLVRLAFMYLYVELHVVSGRKLYDVPFDYEFAAFDAEERAGSLRAVAALRERLSGLGETLGGIPVEAWEALGSLADSRLAAKRRFEAALERLRAEDVAALEHYVKARARLLRRGSKRAAAALRQAGGAIWAGVTRVGE